MYKMAANSSLVTRALVFLVVFVLAVFHTSSETGIFGMQGAEKRTFFNEQKNYALEESLVERRRFRRKPCACNRPGTLYGLCNPLLAFGGKCICKPGFSGRFCDTCSSVSYSYPECKSCNCNVFGALVSKCHTSTGQCSCKERIGGRACDSCTSGFFRFPMCQECRCPRNRTRQGICDNRTGACICLSEYKGDNCEQCSSGYFGFPQCNVCSCTTFGSNTTVCDSKTGQCNCKIGFTGLRCHVCVDLRQTYPHCSPPVKKSGGKDQDNATMPNVTDKAGGRSSSRDEKSDIFCAGNFTCQPPSQIEPSSCADLYYNDTESWLSKCAPCGCFGEGTLSSILSCDKSNGKCHCKNHVHGQACDACRQGYYNAKQSNIFGCSSCQCNYGGSISKKCNIYGQCNCRKNIAGQKCDRVKQSTYFMPDPYHIKFELEEGKLDDGRQAAYEYSHVIFPDFTWKGYVAFGDDQEQISMKIRINKSGFYRVLLRYMLLAKQNGSASVTIRKFPSGTQKYEGVFNFASEVSQSSYAASTDLSNVYLEGGDWSLRITSKSRGLYMDHAALLPESYYNAKQLLIATPGPCHVGIRWYETCVTYKYLPVGHANTYSFPGSSGRILEQGVLKPALNYDDSDMLRILKLDFMSMLSFHQDSVLFTVSVKSNMEKYHIVLEYFNADEKVYRINVKHGGKAYYEHHSIISKCPFKFLCRSAVLNKKNVPSVFQLTGASTVTINGRIHGMIGIHRLFVIPLEVFTSDYLRPHFQSIVKDGRSTESARLPAVKEGIEMVNMNKKLGSYTVTVPSSDWWVLIMTYKQPRYPVFKAEIRFKFGGRTSRRYIDINFCPSIVGCHSSLAIFLNKGTLKVTVRRPIRRDFVVESFSIQRDALFDASVINPTHLDMFEEYKVTCLNQNNLPVANPLSQFCRAASFTQSSEFSGGASACSCHPRGSLSRQCNSIGGKCNCHRNIIGRRCHVCRAGFYNFPNCRNCRCFMAGSVGPECNRVGQCKCRPRYGGSKCNRCKSSLFYAFPSCKPCNCNAEGAFGQFCLSRTGQCQCLSNFRGRKCNMCQVGFYDFPRCIACTCNAAGIKEAGENGTSGCFPGEKNQCSCKENVEGMLCDRCKDRYFSLQLSNPKGCIPCRCDRSGTVNGIATCQKTTGQCYCKRYVDARSRTCDICKDGFYGLDDKDVFGCRPCECNPGGSTSSICEKKTGKCTCKPNITGRKCDRLSDMAMYIPTIRSLRYPAIDGVSVNGKFLRTDMKTGLVVLAQHKEPVQWKITLPKKSKYIFVMAYKLTGKQNAGVTLTILHSVYKSTLFELKITIEGRTEISSDKGSELYVLRKNGAEFPFDLYGGSYVIHLYSNTTGLLLDYISFIPQHFITGETLSFRTDKPCTALGNRDHCIRYSYISIPRKGVYSMELEGTGRRDAEMLDESKYPQLSINGAIIVRKNQPHSISFVQKTSGDFVFLLQYFKPEKPPVEVSTSVKGSTGRTVGAFSLADCPHIFGCRQVMLNKDGVVMTVSLHKGVRYTVSFSTNDSGFAALDLLSLIPESHWSLGFITPTPFCVSWRNACVKTEFTYPEGHFFLPVLKSIAYVKPLLMPPNIRDRTLRPILIDDSKKLIRWGIRLKRGYFNVIFHYFQPYHESTVVKVIINTQFSSIAGNVRFSYCPHIDGCRAAVLSEDSLFDRLEGVFVSGSKIQVTFVNLPDGFQAWISNVLLVRPGLFYDVTSVLTERLIRLSQAYKDECIENYDLKKDLSRNCFDWFFQLVMGLNDGPSKCNCEVRGSERASCNLIGGQCPCKKHVTGRTCSRCTGKRIIFPRCITINSLKGILVSK